MPTNKSITKLFQTPSAVRLVRLRVSSDYFSYSCTFLGLVPSKLGSKRLVAQLRRILSQTGRLQIKTKLTLTTLLHLVHLRSLSFCPKRLDARPCLVLFHTLPLQIFSNTFATMLCSQIGLPTHWDPNQPSRGGDHDPSLTRYIPIVLLLDLELTV